MWDLPGPGIEPMFPALAGRFLTTRHQGSHCEDILVEDQFLGQRNFKLPFKRAHYHILPPAVYCLHVNDFLCEILFLKYVGCYK